jgi:hypothetical protein
MPDGGCNIPPSSETGGLTMMNDLIERLNEGVVIVNFMKATGHVRVLTGTRNLDMIPEDHHPTGNNASTNDDVVRVFDMEAHGWRSFRKDSVISYTYETTVKI